MTYQVAKDGSITRMLSDGQKLVLPPTDNGTPEWAEYKAWAGEDTKTVRTRARNKDGKYKGDDPSTPDINEAWVEVKPARKG
jgi:hypothetical protein